MRRVLSMLFAAALALAVAMGASGEDSRRPGAASSPMCGMAGPGETCPCGCPMAPPERTSCATPCQIPVSAPPQRQVEDAIAVSQEQAKAEPAPWPAFQAEAGIGESRPRASLPSGDAIPHPPDRAHLRAQLSVFRI